MSTLEIADLNENSLAPEIQNKVDEYLSMREKQRQDELERLQMIELLRLQKIKEEEELAAKKKAEKEAETARKVNKNKKE